MLKERNTQACLTKGTFAGYHTRWRGLELYLYGEGGGATKRERGHVKFYPYEKGVGAKRF